MMPYRRSIALENGLGFCSATAAASATDAVLTSLPLSKDLSMELRSGSSRWRTSLFGEAIGAQDLGSVRIGWEMGHLASWSMGVVACYQQDTGTGALKQNILQCQCT